MLLSLFRSTKWRTFPNSETRTRLIIKRKQACGWQGDKEFKRLPREKRADVAMQSWPQVRLILLETFTEDCGFLESHNKLLCPERNIEDRCLNQLPFLAPSPLCFHELIVHAQACGLLSPYFFCAANRKVKPHLCLHPAHHRCDRLWFNISSFHLTPCCQSGWHRICSRELQVIGRLCMWLDYVCMRLHYSSRLIIRMWWTDRTRSTCADGGIELIQMASPRVGWLECTQ